MDNPEVPQNDNLFPKEKESNAMNPVRDFYSRVLAEAGKIVVGQEELIEQLLVAILANGHVLLEGVPGVAKTLIAKTLSKLLGVDFARIQFTPDLMPADITGTKIFDFSDSTFKEAK